MRMRGFAALGALLWFSSPALSDGEINVEYIGKTFGLGSGYNQTTGDFILPCVVIDNPSNDSDNGGEVYSVQRVNSTNELKTFLGVNAYASTFGGMFKADTSVGKMVSSGLQTGTTYFAVEAKITGLETKAKSDVRLTDTGIAALKVSDAFFRQSCGDGFVSSVRGGGEFSAVVSAENITENEANSLDASLRASYASSDVETQYHQMWQKLTNQNQLKVEITRSGQFETPIPSLDDPVKLLEYARNFASSIKKPRTHSIVYQSYSTSPSFTVMRHALRADAFLTFDDTTENMVEAIEAFDLYRDRIAIASDALSNSNQYRDFSHDNAHKFITDAGIAQDALAKLIKACAAQTRAGEPCKQFDKNVLVVLSLPPDLAKIPACNVSAFLARNGTAAKACSAVSLVDGECRCIECQLFTASPYPATGGQSAGGDTCPFMPKNASLSLTSDMNVGVSWQANDHWLQIGINDGGFNLLNASGLPGHSSQISGPVSGTFVSDDHGNFTANLQVAHCQSNVANPDLCTFTPKSNPNAALLTVRTTGP